jgi:hypothetical protein
MKIDCAGCAGKFLAWGWVPAFPLRPLGFAGLAAGMTGF